jgi:hypothetical protein
MRSKVVRFALLLTVLASLGRLPLAFGETFPTHRLQALDQSNSLTLPGGRGLTFVAVGFHPRTQGQLEKALLSAGALQPEANGFERVIEIPVVDHAHQKHTGLIHAFMKQQVKSPALRKVVFPLFTHVQDLKARLGVKPHEDQVFLVVAPDGRILWRQSTPPTQAQLDALAKRLAQR